MTFYVSYNNFHNIFFLNIVFHDDYADTVNAFWKKYYEYNIADPVGMNDDNVISPTKDDYFDAIDSRATNKFGMDTPRKRKKPYLKHEIARNQTRKIAPKRHNPSNPSLNGRRTGAAQAPLLATIVLP